MRYGVQEKPRCRARDRALKPHHNKNVVKEERLAAADADQINKYSVLQTERDRETTLEIAHVAANKIRPLPCPPRACSPPLLLATRPNRHRQFQAYEKGYHRGRRLSRRTAGRE